MIPRLFIRYQTGEYKKLIFTHSHNLVRLCDEMAQLRTGPKSLLDFMLLVRYNVAQ
jgi:hypothetical protein